MQKVCPLFYVVLLSLLSVIVSCSGAGEGQQELMRTYQVRGCVETDSTLVLDRLLLFADSHDTLCVDTIVLDATHRFTCQFQTDGLDELYLCSDSLELCRFYAEPGMEVDFTVSMGHEGQRTQFLLSPTDTINAWLQAMDSLFVDASLPRRRSVLDSIITQAGNSSLRTTLLLRDHMCDVADSIFVRRLLGGLPAEAKPEWLIRSIDNMFDTFFFSFDKTRSRRMAASSFVLNDTTTFCMSDSRSDYLLVYFWSDFSQESVDSLLMLDKLIKKDFADRRLQVLTCCLHAADSAAWKHQVEKVDGQHVWLHASFGDPRIAAWDVHSVPAFMLLDMYNNLQQRNQWGRELRRSLDRVPEKSKTTTVRSSNKRMSDIRRK